MYLSGRPLQAITVNLAAKLAQEFKGDLMMSYAGGADCWNVANLLGVRHDDDYEQLDLLRRAGICARCSIFPKRRRRWRARGRPIWRRSFWRARMGRRRRCEGGAGEFGALCRGGEEG